MEENPYEPPKVPSEAPAHSKLKGGVGHSLVLYGTVAMGALLGRWLGPYVYTPGPFNGAFDTGGTVSGPIVGGFIALVLNLIGRRLLA